MNDRAIDAIAEIFAWVGFGGAALVAIVALVARLVDGQWVRTEVHLGDDDGHRVARWFGDDGRVGIAWLSSAQEHELAGRDSAHVWVRGDRVRMTKGSPLVRFLVWLAVGLAGVGVLAAAASIVLLVTSVQA